MDLNVYNVIKGPVFSDKASKLMQGDKKLVLEVHPSANKHQIEQALEQLFNVKVKRINTIVRKGKIRKFKRHESQGKKRKRAIVELQEGYSIDMLGQPGVSTAPVSKQASEAK